MALDSLSASSTSKSSSSSISSTMSSSSSTFASGSSECGSASRFPMSTGKLHWQGFAARDLPSRVRHTSRYVFLLIFVGFNSRKDSFTAASSSRFQPRTVRFRPGLSARTFLMRSVRPRSGLVDAHFSKAKSSVWKSCTSGRLSLQQTSHRPHCKKPPPAALTLQKPASPGTGGA